MLCKEIANVGVGPRGGCFPFVICRPLISHVLQSVVNPPTPLGVERARIHGTNIFASNFLITTLNHADLQ